MFVTLRVKTGNVVTTMSSWHLQQLSL